jgi:hypothetical protein
MNKWGLNHFCYLIDLLDIGGKPGLIILIGTRGGAHKKKKMKV